VYVLVRFTKDDNSVLEFMTDDHNRVKDGRATFNWRMLFDMDIPLSTLKFLLSETLLRLTVRVLNLKLVFRWLK
jgi:hypothetical protein